MTKNIFFIHHSLVSQFNNIIKRLNGKYNLYFICCTLPPNFPTTDSNDNIISTGDFDENSLEKNGIPILNKLAELHQKNIMPSLIVSHVGYGVDLYASELFPDVPIISYVEWFFQIKNTTDLVKNTYIRQQIEKSSACIIPTKNQRIQFPVDLRRKLLVMHEGINTQMFTPDPTSWGSYQTNPSQPKLITYVSRGFEPIRGFMQFIEGIKLVFEQKANIHVKIVGTDRVYYEDNPDNVSYQKLATEMLNPYMNRVTFTGPLKPSEVKEVFQQSNLHVHFTKNYATSWSLLEAMSMGCLILGSDNGPIREFIADDYNGCVVDYTNPVAVKDYILKMLRLDTETELQMRKAARDIALSRIDMDTCTSKWENLIESLI